VSSGEGFSLRARAQSFVYAFRGIAALLASEHNSRIHAVATIAVVVVGLWLRVNLTEWAVLCLAIGVVWAAEAFNTALESLCDSVAPQRDPLIGRAKDLAAAAVLFAACAAAAAGVFVLGPKLLARLGLL
jgi:diacylglycerol kinase (ATP)